MNWPEEEETEILHDHDFTLCKFRQKLLSYRSVRRRVLIHSLQAGVCPLGHQASGVNVSAPMCLAIPSGRFSMTPSWFPIKLRGVRA